MRQNFYAVLMALALMVQAQGELSFEKSIHDFGLIEESAGNAEYSFSFVNSGDQPVKISNVKASCGCTTPYWTREEILPGDSGKITARYNPRNRPGHFNKSLRVTSNASNSNITLYIKGQVKPKPKTIEDDLPSKYGALRMKYRSLNMGKITTERVLSRSFDVYNDSDTVLTFLKDKMQRPEHVEVRFRPEVLQPKERGEILITYDPEKKNDLGYLTDRLILFTDEKAEPEKRLYVVATIEEYFPPLTEEELAEQPKLTIDQKIHDFGKVKEGDVVTAEFILKNEGPKTLNIRKTKANCGCTVSKLDKDSLEPDEEVVMKVTFNTSRRKGRQYKNVTIFSNDPLAPTQVVSIKAQIVTEDN